MPAAAVIPALLVYVMIAAVKTFVAYYQIKMIKSKIKGLNLKYL